LGDQRILEANSCKYLGIISRIDFSWADQVNHTVQKAWKALYFIMHVLKMENSNMKSLAYMSLVRRILEYGDSCWEPYREGQINALDQVRKRVAKFANHTSGTVWETLMQCRYIACICALFKAYTGEWVWKAMRDKLLGLC
jgi:hypothetical protein